MPTYMLISCGTSVLTNGGDGDTRKRCYRLANEKELGPEDRRWLDDHQAATLQALKTASLADVRRQSAEVNSLAAYFHEPPHSTGRPDHLVLLHTDTEMGRAAAGILEKWMRTQGYQVQLQTTPGLATRSLEEFQSSLSDLVRWSWEEIRGYREAGYRVVFNLTGGFKGVLGFLQVLATFMADETVYLFEGSQELMTIPRLPVHLATDETVRQHLDTFRRMSVLGSASLPECAGLPETLYFEADGLAGLTAWGEIVWHGARDASYSKEVLPSLSPRVRFGEAFLKAAAALPSEGRRVLNLNLDQLARMFEDPANPNPRSLHFQKLQKPTDDGCTHEFYASSEGGAPRCFGVMRGEVLCVERIGRHL